VGLMARLLGGGKEGVEVYRCRGRREVKKRGGICFLYEKSTGIYLGWVLWVFSVCDRSGFGWKEMLEYQDIGCSGVLLSDR
jgi:hypothetical protein